MLCVQSSFIRKGTSYRREDVLWVIFVIGRIGLKFYWFCRDRIYGNSRKGFKVWML